MKRKEIARETLDIMEKGYYETQGKRIEIGALQEKSVKDSLASPPEAFQSGFPGNRKRGYSKA